MTVDRRRESLWREIAAVPGVPGQPMWGSAVCCRCVALISGIDAAALTLRATQRAQDLLGASDDWAGGLDDQQYTLGEGPGVEAFTDGIPVLVADLGSEEARWPGFSDAALAVGTGAVFAFPLQLGGIRLGTLDLYRRRIGGLAAGSVAEGAVLADLITLALLLEMDDAQSSGHEWLRAAGSYHDVNVATGMLAAMLRISLDDAFMRLRGRAFTANRPLLEISRDVLARKINADELNE
ncbi:GAF and ANTAR domain-containing protein [Nocardia sp. CA-128927]|uniref:GAF and ANTAR domain-containing protein n=1 Tax=Nocardia sp. CA-128927 TaxID=3239975 RepID=UPI003D952DD0